MSSEDSRKKEILESAYLMFIERGYRGSSLRDIAEQAGIKAASIYNHFANKEEIFEAVFIEKHPLFAILSILDSVQGETAEELLNNAINRLTEELQSNPGLLNLFFVEVVEMEGKHIPQAIKTNFPPDSNFIRKIFEMKSEIRDIPVPVLIRSLIGTIFANIMFNWFIGEGNLKRWGKPSELTDVFLRGILKT
ncbi:MAG: TetR/AcrR family transcriptional regulator [Candidatus Thorarchaeota archaeon]|nr:TetR/AcrR family transcriptional regulator [Candidatus Thorarchaeota archaeon]